MWNDGWLSSVWPHILPIPHPSLYYLSLSIYLRHTFLYSSLRPLASPSVYRPPFMSLSCPPIWLCRCCGQQSRLLQNPAAAQYSEEAKTAAFARVLCRRLWGAFGRWVGLNQLCVICSYPPPPTVPAPHLINEQLKAIFGSVVVILPPLWVETTRCVKGVVSEQSVQEHKDTHIHTRARTHAQWASPVQPFPPFQPAFCGFWVVHYQAE